MARNIEQRLARLETAQRTQDAGRSDVVYTTDGSELGLALDPIDGGWAVLLFDGQPFQAWPTWMWVAI